MAGIKICGITNEQDAVMLNSLGIDYLGFIITDSIIPWRIEPEKAKEIISLVDRRKSRVVLAIGQMSRKKAEELISMLDPDILQIQREMETSDISIIKKHYDIEIWKTIFYPGISVSDALAHEEIADHLLIHTSPESWSGAKEFSRNLKKPFVLAGGLSPENASQAISLFQPMAIDLIRGVEKETGKKDRKLVEKLVLIVKTR